MIEANLSELVLSGIQIEEKIGSGGSGVVYMAWHTRLRKHVVIKEQKHSSINDIESRSNEVEALKIVKSAYVPHVLDYLLESDRSFTMMEYIEGESFDRLIARGVRFTEIQVAKWYSQLATALYDIHRQNVCHLDIKPANIILKPDGDVCLIDFNTAIIEGNDIRLVSRSMGYASPEQDDFFRRFVGISDDREPQIKNDIEGTSNYVDTRFLNDGNSAVDSDTSSQYIEKIDWKRSDIYSLGATMYHLLTGSRPPRQAGGIVPVPESGCFSSAIADIIGRSMQIDPAERFQSASHLAEALRCLDSNHM